MTESSKSHLRVISKWANDQIIYPSLTIHAPVGSANSRILFLVYTLMTSKSEGVYRCLFEELVDFAAENNVNLQPSTILTDFKQALINASRQEIPDAFDMLKLVMPPEANEVTQWFEDNYVHRKIRRHLRNGNTIRSAPLFPPELWSVYDSIKIGVPRIQNIAEAWHR
ncbi:uncharacterized protein LOC111041937 [Rhizophagus clarus]|uniref:Uncharacterized protein LOC111041937 n=1 Tax=Rhizophagus clarus TaxID=94130 RepID=A0A8H3L8Q8_9GLOM|nr:uncharacterized protein LOC111041937 [Rhizophagus clarus]